MFGTAMDDMYDVIVKGWERTENNNGVPYYVNHKSERTTWDHPYFEKLMTELKEMESVKYAAYRTALKLRHLQKSLKLDQITLFTVSTTLSQYGYQDGMEAVLDCEELKLLLTEMYSRIEQLSQKHVQIHADLLQNFLLNAYDVKRSGRVNVLSVKVAMGCLCSGRLSEKYKYFYRQLCDSSFFINRKMLGAFLLDSLQIPGCLHERRVFGSSNITPAVDSCLRLSGQGPGISEDSFISWLLKEPQTLVWLPTLHRVAASELVKHRAKCSVCKACPIVGFRYRCLLCFSFDICQQCFLAGKTGKGHKLKHPIQEYCLPTSSKEETKAFMKTLRNHLSKKHRRKTKPKYLPINGTEFFETDKWTAPVSVPNHVVLTKTQSIQSNSHTVQSSDVRLPHKHFVMDKVNNRRPQQQSKLVENNKENFSPHNWLSVPDEKNLSISVENPVNLENLIGELEAENRLLYQHLAEVNHTEKSETESNASITDELEEENEVLEAKMEALEHHNSSLSDQLTRLRKVLRMSPQHSESAADGSEPAVQDVPRQTSVRSLPSGSSPVSAPNDSSFYSDQTGLGDASPVTIGDLCTPEAEVQIGYSPQDLVFSSPYLMNVSLRDMSDSLLEPPTGWDSVDGIIDNDRSTAHFTLPSISQSQTFPDAERELDSMVHKMTNGFPASLSYSHYHSRYGFQDSPDDVLSLAKKLGAAMSDYVTAISDSKQIAADAQH